MTTTPPKRQSPRAAGSGADTEQQARANPSMSTAGLCTCGDPPPPGWSVCRHCTGWHNLATALEFSDFGIDTHRLRRGLYQIRASHHPRLPVRLLLEKLTRRVAELELLAEIG